jgi:hypothetical protein
MLVSDTVITLVTIGLAVLFALDAVEVWHIYVVMFISGMVLIWRAALHSNGHMRVVYPCGNANRHETIPCRVMSHRVSPDR